MPYSTFSMGAIAEFAIDVSDGGTLVNISEAIASCDFSGSKEIKELKRLGNNQTAKLAGPVGSEFKLKLHYDPTLIAIFRAAALTAGTTTRSFAYAPAGTAASSEKLTGECVIGAISEQTNPDDPHDFDITLPVAGNITVGTCGASFP